MTTSSGEDDERLMEELRAALRAAGRPTAAMEEAGRAAFSWRSVDAELAGLDLEPSADAPRQGDYDLARDDGSGPSVLRFTLPAPVGEEPATSIELQESDDGWAGMLEPAAEGLVTVYGPAGEVLETAPVDELGTFFIAPRGRGPVRLRCRTPSGEILTDWCLLR